MPLKTRRAKSFPGTGQGRLSCYSVLLPNVSSNPKSSVWPVTMPLPAWKQIFAGCTANAGFQGKDGWEEVVHLKKKKVRVETRNSRMSLKQQLLQRQEFLSFYLLIQEERKSNSCSKAILSDEFVSARLCSLRSVSLLFQL